MFDTGSANELALETSATTVRPGQAFRELVSHPSAAIGLIILSTYVLAALIVPLFVPFDPAAQDLEQILEPPSWSHPCGTDELGRDVLLRLIVGARYSLGLGLFAVAIGLVVGVPMGAISGYLGGRTDIGLQRLVEVVQSFPSFVLALSLIAVLGVGLRNVVIAVGISSIPAFSRVVRSSALALRELPYVEASHALGGRRYHVLTRHILRNSLTPVIVLASLELGTAILVASGLGFLGLGIQPPTPEWGAMLGSARNYIFAAPYLTVFPGLAIFFAVLAFNLLGDGLRDIWDPRSQRIGRATGPAQSN